MARKAASKSKKKVGKQKVVRINLSGPITILGCAAQGCTEFIMEGTLAQTRLRAEILNPKKP